MSDETSIFDLAADDVVELANRLAETYPDEDLWEIAQGVIAGAVHYWLYAYQPLGDETGDDNADLRTATGRLRALFEEVQQSAEESEYLHSPNDRDVGRA